MVWGYMLPVQGNDIHMYIPVPMMYTCRWYLLIMYWYTYGMEITNWYAYAWYTHTYTLLLMMYTCIWYLIRTHWNTYGMEITNWYD